MSHMSTIQVVILAAITLSFVLFGVTLFVVSLYVSLGKPPEPVARQVTPAKRVGETGH